MVYMFGVRCFLSSVIDLLSKKNYKGTDWEKAKTQTEVWIRTPFVRSIFSLD